MQSVDEKINQLHAIATDMIKRNCGEAEIINALVKEGITKSYAELIINNVTTDRHKKKESVKLLIMGVFVLLVGIFLNYFSYRSAENSGSGTFWLFWGFIVTGVITITRAIILYTKT